MQLSYILILFKKMLLVQGLIAAKICILSYKNNITYQDINEIIPNVQPKNNGIIYIDYLIEQFYVIHINTYECLVLFRGTDSFKDLFYDMQTTRVRTKFGKIHNGFYAIYNKIKVKLKELINNYKYVTFIGHSLGGAIATIAAVEIAYENSSIHCYCCTFGSPRVGDREFAQSFRHYISFHRRYVDPLDGITRLPLSFRFRFTHVSKPIYIRDLCCFISLIRPHFIQHYHDQLEKDYRFNERKQSIVNYHDQLEKYISDKNHERRHSILDIFKHSRRSSKVDKSFSESIE